MKEKIIAELQKLSGHDFVALTTRGNTAIMAALESCKKINSHTKVLIPDQGGWLTYKEYPIQLGMEIIEVKTDLGIIDISDLKEKIKDASCFIYANPAGYFAHQPMKEIYGACAGKCLVIMDVCGIIGDIEYGKYCDFSVCSFGRWKPINAQYGGFISTQKYFEQSKKIFETQTFDEKHCETILEKIKNVKNRMNKLYELCEKIKKELKEFNVLHKESKGINVVARFSSEEEKEKLIKYCKENNYEYTTCPRYIRVNEDAISIEVKRIEV